MERPWRGRAVSFPTAGNPASTSTGLGGGALYSFAPTLELAQRLAPNGWTLEGELRVESGQWITLFRGDGSRRFLPRWAIDGSGDLVVTLEGLSIPPIVLASGAEATAYHRHRIVYDPVTQQALYSFDDRWIALWGGSASALDGVYFGQGSSLNDGAGYFREVGIAPNSAPLPVPEAALGRFGVLGLALVWIGILRSNRKTAAIPLRRERRSKSAAISPIANGDKAAARRI